MREPIAFLFSLFLFAGLMLAQQQPAGNTAALPNQQSMPGMDMPGHDMSGMKDMPTGDKDNDASSHVMHSMEGHMDMGPHMKMTALRAPKAGDVARAQEVVEAARKASEKYLDYHAALSDGYKIFPS